MVMKKKDEQKSDQIYHFNTDITNQLFIYDESMIEELKQLLRQFSVK